MVKIRLQRVGAKKAPFYHIVVADSRTSRDGKIIEQIGTYDPMKNPAAIVLDKEKVATWIKNGAQPTDTVKALIIDDTTYHQLLGIEKEDGDFKDIYKIKVDKEEMGKVIGRQGKIAQAIRTIAKSLGAKDKKRVDVEFVD